MSDIPPPLPSAAIPALRWGQLYGCAQAESIICALADSKLPALVVAPDMGTASRFEAEMRFFAQDRMEVFLLPDWETLPYDLFSPREEVIAKRVEILRRLPKMRNAVCVTTVDTLLQYIVPVEFTKNSGLSLKVGDRLNPAKFRRELDENCYLQVPQVTCHGEYAIRGCVIDVYPPASKLPIRVDLFDDRIESLRPFSPVDQVSVKKQDAASLYPARDFLLNEATIRKFRQRFRELFEAPDARLYHDVSNGIIPGGIEYYLPLFFDNMATLFDYVPNDTIFFIPSEFSGYVRKYWQLVRERHAQAKLDRGRPLLPPEHLFLDEGTVDERMLQFRRVAMQSFQNESNEDYNGGTCLLPPVSIYEGNRYSFRNFRHFLKNFGGRVLIAAKSRGYREQIIAVMRKNGLDMRLINGWLEFCESDFPLCICIADIRTGSEFTQRKIAIIPDGQILGKQSRMVRRRVQRSLDAAAIIRSLDDLALHSPVVHEEHGVGRYCGLEQLDVRGTSFECLVLEYAEGDKLYVPISSLHLVTRYIGGSAENAPLHKLGSTQWKKSRTKAAQRAFDIAAELLDTQARRKTVQSAACKVDDKTYLAFTSTFCYEETPDQLKVMEEIRADMERRQPMDRIVCGDVGFGKTEIAMRAAFIALQSNQQVAVLVPTTLLANQHFENFSSRFADWPVRIDLLSRFTNRDDQSRIIDGLAAGNVDLVIGTHRLLAAGISYKKLGLVVIDEEQHFGVRHKERLKRSAAASNILTLSATPIPRTLGMSLSKLRDLSLITTPPPDRRPIKTFVKEWNDSLMFETCQREAHRGGQIYFIHNRISDIEKITAELSELLPWLDIRFAHGQMPKRDLENVMLQFYRKRFNMLVCTSIIESGIDISSANSIIINEADHFGLAQLHQLRGRVGRSDHQAYAYLILSKPRALLQEDARKRLEAVESLEKLGTGFTLAMHDLEIRGGGELLGEEQSGQIHEVGFAMYNDLLKRAVDALQSGKVPNADEPLNIVTEVDLGEPAFIPEKHIPDINLRLVLYRRIAAASDERELTGLRTEMIDRFGPMPEASENLFKNAVIRLKCRTLDIQRVEITARNGNLQFGANPRINIDQIIALVQKKPESYRFGSNNKLVFDTSSVSPGNQARMLHELLAEISSRQQVA